MTPTEQYINALGNLKRGELGLLRSHAGQSLDESLDGFDLFTGTWWPLRAKNQRAPRREVAWLLAKLYAFRPILHSPGETLAYQLGRLRPAKHLDQGRSRVRFDRRFDEILTLPLRKIEPALQWALDQLASNNLNLDWVRLTDNLSFWERESTRLNWAKEFLESSRGGEPW